MYPTGGLLIIPWSCHQALTKAAKYGWAGVVMVMAGGIRPLPQQEYTVPSEKTLPPEMRKVLRGNLRDFLQRISEEISGGKYRELGSNPPLISGSRRGSAGVRTLGSVGSPFFVDRSTRCPGPAAVP